MCVCLLTISMLLDVRSVYIWIEQNIKRIQYFEIVFFVTWAKSQPTSPKTPLKQVARSSHTCLASRLTMKIVTSKGPMPYLISWVVLRQIFKTKSMNSLVKFLLKYKMSNRSYKEPLKIKMSIVKRYTKPFPSLKNNLAIKKVCSSRPKRVWITLLTAPTGSVKIYSRRWLKRDKPTKTAFRNILISRFRPLSWKVTTYFM